MGVVRTDQWLLKHNYHPLEVCSEFLPYFKNVEKKALMHYLQQNGMYNSAIQGKRDCKLLAEEDICSKVETLLEEYKKLWNGPDIPIFIFPIKKQSFFVRSHFKSGLAFSDKLFLFLSPRLNQHHLEALFIHEYHHVCRIKKQKKPMEEYTVADAIILEGLAEYTVNTIKGEKYLAPWTKQYSSKFLQSYWDSTFKEELLILKSEKKHDQIIYGRGQYPAMIGYCMGYHLVEKYVEEKGFSLKSSFTLTSDEIIDKYLRK